MLHATRRTLIAVSILSLFLCPAPALQNEPENQNDLLELAQFFQDNDIMVADHHRVLKATLVTLASGKMVVRSTGQKTMVLGIDPQCQVKDGRKALKTADLNRGETLVLILESEKSEVNRIYRYR